MAAKACCLLRAERRWVVSGTIIQNSLEDVYSLIRFLRHEPFCERTFWNNTITKAQDFSTALNRVRDILSPIMIRRTKETRDNTGQPILTLPSIDSKTVVVQFSPEEREFYEALYRKSFDIFDGFLRAGTVSTSWIKIFSLLLRLRQTCSHVALTIKSYVDDKEWSSIISESSLGNGSKVRFEKEAEDKDCIDQSFLKDLLKKFGCMQEKRPVAICSESENYSTDHSEDEFTLSVANMLNQTVQSNSSELNDECPICLENISLDDAAITPCLHIFCKDCLLGFFKNCTQSSRRTNLDLKFHTQNRDCPVCSKEVDSRRVLQMTRASSGKIQTDFLLRQSQGKSNKTSSGEEDGKIRNHLKKASKGSSSSKLVAILEELQLVWEKEPGSKVLIFSQFLGFLDIIEKSLASNGISFWRFDGKLSQNQRMKVLLDFESEPQKTAFPNSTTGSVLLMSMKAGGVGLNLVTARSVFIVDPWWNAAVEDQCVDRIHRIGQSAEKIYVRKFYVANSIEERILELQRRKKGIARVALCDDRSTQADRIGTRPSLEDLKILFKA